MMFGYGGFGGYGYGGFGGCGCGGFGYGGCGYGGFALIVVLFILLIIVGAVICF
ncbi:YjcZ family sporulation protein [Neobacillus cucumis]|nr:YjcZ family sporulation protein [Neobacillus cucumis]MED4225288.1 YjcZ family sporulation protein [Neobacillus cucumis]